MRFIADSMLGRLARWLRLLGYDTLYHAHIEDSLLLRIAREEDRILLTRDTRIVKVRGMKNFLLLHDNDSFQQLKDVIGTFDLFPLRTSREAALSSLYSRCSLCNTRLEEVSKEQVKDRVPEYVYHTTDHFKRCKVCDRFYWQGTHREKLKKKLLDVL